MRRSVSTNTAPSTAICPRSGRISPAIALTTEVLPAPERPNSAVRPPSAGKMRRRARSCRAGARYRPRSSPSVARQAPADTPRHDLGSEQRRHRDRDRDEGQPQRRRDRRRAPGSRCRSPVGKVCVSPGMFETKVIVAPNSPRLRAKHSTMPAMMPGRISGRVISDEDPKCARRRASRPPLRAGGRPRRATAGSPAPSAGTP